MTKYQFLKLIRETSQLDLDRCLTSSITQFIGYFKYRIIDAYNPVCIITNCFSVLDLNILTINSQHNVLYYGLVMNNVCVTSCYELEMLDEHTASLFNLLICNGTPQPPPPPPHSKCIKIIIKSYHFTFFSFFSL